MKPTMEILTKLQENSKKHHDEVFTRLYRYLLRPDIDVYKRQVNCWSSATLSIWGNPTTICVNGNVQVESLWDNMGNLIA